MEKYINRVHLVGNIGQEPKFFTAGGKKAARFSLATGKYWKDADGNIRSETAWHSVCVWENRNTNLSVLHRGEMVELIGELRNNRFTDKDGREVSLVEITALAIDRPGVLKINAVNALYGIDD